MADDDEAKDLLQDAFVEAFLKIKKLNDIDFFSAWMKRITVNKCLNALRKKKLFVLSLDDGLDVAEEDEGSDQDLIQAEAKNVLRAVEQLAPGSRAVLNMYLFEGYDHKEIADILNISESASKSQYCKAKAKIREILDKQKGQQYGTG